jgi:hypothetical protein
MMTFIHFFLWEIGSFFWEVNKLLLFSFKKDGIMLMYISMKLYSGGTKKLWTVQDLNFRPGIQTKVNFAY